MAPKIGVGSSWSFQTETTLGTFVAPTRSLGYGSATLTPNRMHDEEDQMVGGVVAGRVEDDIFMTEDATLSAECKVKAAKFGQILNTITGSTVTPTGTTAKTYNFPFGLVAPTGANSKSLSSQIGFSDGSAASFRGGQTTKLSLSASKQASLKASLEQYGMQVQAGTGAPAKASPVYTTSEGFGFKASTLEFAGGAIGSCVSSWDLDLNIPRATGEHCLNGSQFPLEAFVNGLLSASGTFTAKWDSDAQVDAFLAGTWRSMQLECFTASDLAGAGGTKGEFTIDIANFRITGAPINVGGPGAIELQMPFTVKQASSDPLVNIKYVTLDTAL